MRYVYPKPISYCVQMYSTEHQILQDLNLIKQESTETMVQKSMLYFKLVSCAGIPLLINC